MFEDLDRRIESLQRRLPDYADDLGWALRNAGERDIRAALTRCRICNERVIKTIYKRDLLKEPDPKNDALADPGLKQRVERRVLTRMRTIRDLTNLGPHDHDEPLQDNDVRRVLDDLCEVLEWCARRYHPYGRSTGAPPPDPPARHRRGRALPLLLCVGAVGIGLAALSLRTCSIEPPTIDGSMARSSAKPTTAAPETPAQAPPAQQKPVAAPALAPAVSSAVASAQAAPPRPLPADPLNPPPLTEPARPDPSSAPPHEPQWTAHPSGTADLLLTAWRTPGGALYLAGRGGTLLHSRDGGRSFVRQPLPPRAARATLFALSGGPDGSVYAVGTDGTILRLPRADAAWERLPSGTEEELRGIVAEPDGALHVVGDRGLILRLPPHGTPARENPVGSKDSLYAVRRLNGALYAVGDGGAILRAAGGRAPWRRLDSGTTAPLWDITAVGDTLLVVGDEQPLSPTGEPGFKQGFVLRGSARSPRFQRVPLPEAQNPLYSIATHGQDVIAAGSGRALLRSTDGGVSFHKEASGALDDPALRRMPAPSLRLGVFAADDGEVYLFGSQGMIFHRSLGGQP